MFVLQYLLVPEMPVENILLNFFISLPNFKGEILYCLTEISNNIQINLVLNSFLFYRNRVKNIDCDPNIVATVSILFEARIFTKK